MKADLLISDEGKNWGMYVTGNSPAAEIFLTNYFKGKKKVSCFITAKDKSYFLALALSCNLTIEIMKNFMQSFLVYSYRRLYEDTRTEIPGTIKDLEKRLYVNIDLRDNLN